MRRSQRVDHANVLFRVILEIDFWELVRVEQPIQRKMANKRATTLEMIRPNKQHILGSFDREKHFFVRRQCHRFLMVQ